MVDYNLIPPDGGWGWLVLAGATLVNILIPGTIKSFGVLFVEFLEAFDASPTEAAWIPALCYFLYSSLGIQSEYKCAGQRYRNDHLSANSLSHSGPVSSILSVKYSYRTVTLIGGFSAVLGMVSSFWASSVVYLYLSYGILVGTGAGLAFPPTVYIVTSYFVKFRGLANGLCISGSALGSIILPPMLRYLLETYGYRGSVLIMGAVTMNVWIGALFYEPVEQHMIRVPKNQKLEDIEEEDAGIVLQFENTEQKSEIKLVATSDESLGLINSTSEQQNISNGNSNFIRSASAAGVDNINKNFNDNVSSRSRKISISPRILQRNQTFNTTQLSSNHSLYVVPEYKKQGHTVHGSKSALQKRSPSTSSFQYISTPYHGSTLSFQPKEFSSHLSLKSTTNISKYETENKHQRDTKKDYKQKFFDVSLLKDPVYLIILISNSTNAISYTNFIILLPAHAIQMGFDRSLAAYLISIVSMTDLIGRIGGSALSDMNIIPKTWYFVGGLALSGVSLALLPLTKTYTMISLCCAIFGLASGVYVGITAVIMADMLGTQRLTSSYGISLFVNGILQLMGPPLCGIWYESVGSYIPLFTALGLVLLGGAGLWSLMPFANKETQRGCEITAENESNLIEKI